MKDYQTPNQRPVEESNIIQVLFTEKEMGAVGTFRKEKARALFPRFYAEGNVSFNKG